MNKGTLTATIATLASGVSANFTLVAQVSNTTCPGTVLSNTPSIGPSTWDNNTANNSVTFTTTTGVTTTTSIGAPTVTSGDNASVTVSVSSASGTPTGNVTLAVNNGSPITQALDSNGQSIFTLSGLDADTYNLSASYAAQGSFLASSATGSLTVNPLAVTLSGSRVYDTTATADASLLTVSNEASGDVSSGGLTLSGFVTLAGADVGSESISDVSKLTLGGSSAGDYTLTGFSGSVTITQATPTVPTPTASDATYDGNQHGATAGDVTGVGGVDLGPAMRTYYAGTYTIGSLPGSGGSLPAPITAGTYTVVASYADSTDYTSAQSADVAVFTIAKAPTTTTTYGAAPFTYNGSSQIGCSGSVIGSDGLNTSATSLTYSANADGTGVADTIDAGTYYVTAHYAGNINHEASDGAAVAIVINQAPTMTTTFGAAPFTYNGSSQIGGSGSVIGADGLNTSATSLTYSANSDGTGVADTIDAGTYYVTAHYAGDINHVASDGAAVAIVINQATPAVAISDAGGTYNSSAFPATATVAGVVPGVDDTPSASLDGVMPTLTYYVGSNTQGTVLSGAPINAGTYTVVASFAGSTDYAAPQSSPLTFTIAQANLTVTSTTDDGGVGTLRWIINQLNADSSNFTGKEIDFAIGTLGSAQTINLTSALPALTANGVYINGLSQGGNGNTTQLITLNGTNAGAGSDGLLLQGSNCTISGLILEGFSQNGIEVDGSNNIIGGTATGAGNVLSGNGGDGLLIDSSVSGVQVQGNVIGVNSSAKTALANGVNGIEVKGASNTIGGTAYADRNIISGNARDGVILDSTASGNVVLGNYVGVNYDGLAALHNSIGIEVAGTNSTIGGIPTGSRNVVSGNTGDGVLLDSTASGNLVLGNYVGINGSGTVALGNNVNGIEVAGTSNTLGGTAQAARNVISANGSDGVLLDSAASGNQLLGNYIGTDTSGMTALANKVGIEDAGNNNTLGGSVLGAHNIISGNTGDGVLLGSGATNEMVQGNFIGLNEQGSAALANGTNGLEVKGMNNTVGGSLYSERNFVSGNGNDGLLLDSGANGNQVLGNFVGLDVSGKVHLGNTANGIEIASSNNTLGGAAANCGNVISGNGGDGVLLDGTATANIIQANDVGTDYTGANALGNSSNGIEVIGVNNSLGGTTAGAGNVLAANSNNGVQIDSGASGTLVLGNYIGTNAAGGSLGNRANGVSIASNNNTIGGNAYRAANTIANNTGDGVLVNGGTGNSLLRRSILGNTGLGISLTNGGNNDVTAPSITSASYSGGRLTVGVSFDAPLANVSYAIALFASPSSDEGAVYLGTVTLTPTSTGTHSFTYKTATTVVTSNPIISATVTDSSGDTSEFSPGVSV